MPVHSDFEAKKKTSFDMVFAVNPAKEIATMVNLNWFRKRFSFQLPVTREWRHLAQNCGSDRCGEGDRNRGCW